MPLPVNPGVPGVGAPDQNYEQNVQKWDQFLERATSPGVANSLLTSALTIFQGRQPGESNTGVVARGLQTGLNAYTQGKQRDFENAQQLGTAQRDQQRVGILGDQQQETSRHNKESEAIDWARIESTKSYYESMARSMRAKQGLKYSDALNIARQSVDKQLEEMGAMMQFADPKDPAYQDQLKAYRDLQQNYNRLLEDRARGYMQLAGSETSGSPSSGRTGYGQSMSEASVAQLRGRPGWSQADEDKLAKYMGDFYTPPGAPAPAAPSATAPPVTPTADGEPSIEDLLKRYRNPAPNIPTNRRTPEGTAWANAVEQATSTVKEENRRGRLEYVDEATLRTALHGDLNKFELRNILRELVARQATPVTGE